MILFEEDFTSGTFGKLTPGMGPPVIVSDIFHNTPYSMRVLNKAASASISINDPSTIRRERYWIMINRWPDSSHEFYFSVCGQGIAIGLVGPVGGDAMYIYSSAGNIGDPEHFEAKWYGARSNFQPNVWHLIDLYLKEGVLNAQAILKVDNVERINISSGITIFPVVNYQYGFLNPYSEAGPGDIDFHFEEISLSTGETHQLNILASPSEVSNMADIILDAVSVGKTPLNLPDVTEGPHTIAVPSQIEV